MIHTQQGQVHTCLGIPGCSLGSITPIALSIQVSGSGAEGLSSIIAQGGEPYGLDDPRAEMDLLRHEMDISIDQKLKGVERRLQVSHALTALRQNLMTDLETRFQFFDDRLQVSISDFRFQISDFRFQISDFRFQVSNH